MTAAGVRPQERRVAILVTGVFAALEAGRGIGEVGANTLVVGRLGAGALPVLYIPLGLLSLVAALAYGAALGRFRRGPLFVAILVGFAALFVVERLAIAAGIGFAVPITWLTVFAAGAIAVTMGWTVAASTFDARQAKRLFPVCTAAAIVGNFAGALASGPVAALISTETLVVVEAGMFIIAAGVIWHLAAVEPTPAWARPKASSRSIVTDVRTGFDEVRRSPLQGLISVAYVLLAVLLFSVSVPFFGAAKSAVGSETELAATLGLISAAVTGAAFLVSLLVANRFYARFGVAAAALLLPVVYAIGFGVWIAQFTFATAAIVQSTVQVTQRGLSNAAWSAFYNTVPARSRAQVMAFQDGVPGQIGTVLSGVLLLTAARLLAPEQVFWLGLAVALVTIGVVVAIRRRYVASLLATLRRGVSEQVLEGGPGLGDLITAPDVRAVLVTALADPDPRVREMAASMLARAPGDDTLDALAAALDDPDPGVRAAAATALAGHDAVHPEHVERALAAIDALLAGEGRGRIAGLEALTRLGRRPTDDQLRVCRNDTDPRVRAATVASLAIEPPDLDGLVGALRDPVFAVRHAAAEALAARPAVPEGVIALLDDGDPAVQAEVVAAMVGHGSQVRDTLVAWADAKVDRAMGLAAARVSIGAAPPSPDVAFLVHVLRVRRDRQQDLALGALAVLEMEEARSVIRRCLRSTDADVRAQAIETLDTLGDRRLGRAIARLVEVDQDVAAARPLDAVLTDLRHDGDPWIRILAGRVADGGAMPGPDADLGEIERMLELRRVPLFERLDPEDLQRVAAVADERSFAAGVVIVREGEVGDELFVLLDGTVRVERLEPDGSIRLLRTYGPGDHFGELAVLLQRPRVASVVAVDAVRTLVIGGDGLTAILRERPDAAMAMLATLAERISAQ
jgi:HEAT repeat protein